MFEGTKGLYRKVSTLTSPFIRFFVAILRFVVIYAVFWKTLGKKRFFFGSNSVFIGQEVYYQMLYNAYYTELHLQICNTHKSNAFVAKIANTRLTKVLWPFLPSPKGCQLLPPWITVIYIIFIIII